MSGRTKALNLRQPFTAAATVFFGVQQLSSFCFSRLFCPFVHECELEEGPSHPVPTAAFSKGLHSSLLAGRPSSLLAGSHRFFLAWLRAWAVAFRLLALVAGFWPSYFGRFVYPSAAESELVSDRWDPVATFSCCHVFLVAS